jgi:hypothetical protein
MRNFTVPPHWVACRCCPPPLFFTPIRALNPIFLERLFEEKYSIIEQNVTTHVVESREPTKAEIYNSWHTFFPTWGTPTPFQTELGPENTVHCIFVHSSSKKKTAPLPSNFPTFPLLQSECMNWEGTKLLRLTPFSPQKQRLQLITHLVELLLVFALAPRFL